MATFDVTKGGDSGHPTRRGVHAPYVVENVVDFAENDNAANDVFETINLPAGTVVLMAGVEVLRADDAGNSGTLSLVANGDEYVDDGDPSSEGYLTSAAENFNLYADNETLDLVVGTGEIDARVRAFALVCDVSQVNDLAR